MNKKENATVEILVAEDSATQAELLKILLEENHYKVSTAKNGKDALEQLARHQPALVISDVIMPELDGYGLCKVIKSDNKLKHIPVMLVTTLSDPEDVISGLECGADNFIRKPYEEKYLLSRIKYLLMNIELRKNQRMQMALEINIGGKKHFISAERQQILDLLVSTYEQAVLVNSELKEREQQLAHTNQVLQGLNRIAKSLNSAVSEQEVAESALRHAMELPGIHAGWISIHESNSNFRLAATCGLPPALTVSDAFDGDCACRQRLLKGEFDAGTNIIKCERLARASGDTQGLCCHASIPLWLGEGRALGVMNLAGQDSKLFSEDELKILYSIGNQVAVALERARLHEKLETLVTERTAKLAAEIEERKRIEQEQARLVSIIEATPDFVGTSDLAGHPIFTNRAGLAMLGIEPEEGVSAINTANIHTDWAAKRVKEEGIPYAIEHSSWSGETALLRPDGTEIPVSQVIIAHRGAAGDVEFLSTIMRDISQRKEAEDELRILNESLEQRVAERTADLERARREADEANSAKSAFLSTMSHEIRTPMNGVIGMVEVLAQSKLSEHQSELVRTIMESAHTLLRIIDDILDFSKIEASRLEIEYLPLSVADLVEGLCNSLVPVARSKGVVMNLFVSPDIPEHVLSDDVRLRQVLYNLIGNAIKFSGGQPERNGDVSIRVEKLEATPLQLVFRISDNGVGMKPETLEYLFTPFTQAEIATTRRFGGTGLGLAICKRLVDLMQGEISVESSFGNGSVFTIILPFEVPEEQPKRIQPDLSAIHCIVMESEQLNLADMQAYLENAGARVHPASNSKTLKQSAGQLTGPVVFISHIEQPLQPEMQTTFDTLPNLHQLLITQGRRRRARLDKHNLVTLDGDALRRHTLLHAVAVAAGQASPEAFNNQQESDTEEEIIPPSTVAEAREQGRLILIAEDDDLNQRVILQQLNLLGHVGVVANNGVEALAMLKEGDYALLLSDLHMPEMDGYTLAQIIRREERNQRHMPILALTANALRGEANRAHDAGMDEYLTKPIPLKKLKATLEKWLPRNGTTTETSTKTHLTETSPLVDISVLKGLLGENNSTAHEFLKDYLDLAKQLVADMHTASLEDDLEKISAVTHKLKSSSSSVGAMSLDKLCTQLEHAYNAGNKDLVVQKMREIETTFDAVAAEIHLLLSQDLKEH